ncbi:hypothetical protein [Magnetospirillum sp. UT-4]|nr:hypothetical protein [Magnetospirillum sp. UT-4]CAA7626993.1 hypothetical protein MTBUT4_90046 [Magnetospirillum sp. UT-4]
MDSNIKRATHSVRDYMVPPVILPVIFVVAVAVWVIIKPYLG